MSGMFSAFPFFSLYYAILVWEMKHASTYHCFIEPLQSMLLARGESRAALSRVGCNAAYVVEIHL